MTTMLSEGLTMPLHAFETGARMWRPSASRFDFAYLRLGRVVRENGKIGVLYVGASAVIEYGEDDLFAYATHE